MTTRQIAGILSLAVSLSFPTLALANTYHNFAPYTYVNTMPIVNVNATSYASASSYAYPYSNSYYPTYSSPTYSYSYPTYSYPRQSYGYNSAPTYASSYRSSDGDYCYSGYGCYPLEVKDPHQWVYDKWTGTWY